MNFFIFFVYISTLNRVEIFEKYEIIKKIVMLAQIWSPFYVKTDIYIYIYILADWSPRQTMSYTLHTW